MRVGKRTLAVVAGAALAAAALAGCSAGSGGGGTTTITYFSWNNEASMQPIVDAFEKENPTIKVDMSAAQGQANDYAQTLTTRIAGGQVPDVFHMSIETRSAVIDGGYAKDLSGEKFMKTIDPTASQLYTKDGKVYGMAPTAWAGGIVYNKDLLKKVGYSSVPKTWDGFLKLGKKLKAAGVTAYMEDPSVVSGSFSPQLGGYYAKQGITGGDDEIFDGKTTFSKAWTPLLTQWDKMVKDGVMPADTVGVNADQIKQEFENGQLAMFRSGPWDFKDLNTSKVNYAMGAFPGLDGGEPYVGGGPDSPYTISSKISGAKLQASAKFLSFINSAKGLKLAQENLNQISTSKAYTTKVAPQMQQVYEDYIKPGRYYWVNWPTGGTVMGQEVAAQWQLLIQGKSTPAQVTAALDAKWATAKK